MKRYGLYNHPQARIIGEMVEVEFGTWVRYEDVAAIETKYSEAVEFIEDFILADDCPDEVKDRKDCDKRNSCDDCKYEEAEALLKRHKEEV